MDSTTISQPLQRLLEQYQLSSLNSLCGPSIMPPVTTTTAAALLPPPSTSPLSPIRPNAERPLTVEKSPFRDSLLEFLATMNVRNNNVVAAPYLMTPRDHSAERHESLLEGEIISCFNVGGEKRLCLPQILSSVLRDYDYQEIHKACSELHIYCSPCSSDQLEVLKLARVLPLGSTTCSLITKTDAERLCNYLSYARRLRRNRSTVTSSTATVNNADGLSVYHECFGRCRGRFFDDKYTSLSAECVACNECQELFAPDRFVLHSHNHETKICHWGFDSANWRAYLHLPSDIENDKECLERLKKMKAKFYNIGGVTAPVVNKRPMVDSLISLPQVKRPRCEPQLPFIDSTLPMKLQQIPVQHQQQTSSLPFSAGTLPLPPLLLCDPIFLAYYHALANVRLNSACSPSAFPSMPMSTTSSSFPMPSTSFSGMFGGEKSFCNNMSNNSGSSNLTMEEAAAALLKLAPTKSATSTSQTEFKCHKQAAPDSSSTHIVCNEPLKKHILHRTQSKQQLSSEKVQSIFNEKVQSLMLPLNSSSLRHSLEEDTRAIDALLRQYIADSEGLHVVQAKLEETRRAFDTELESLLAQNNILQQEIAYLRNKHGVSSTIYGPKNNLTATFH